MSADNNVSVVQNPGSTILLLEIEKENETIASNDCICRLSNASSFSRMIPCLFSQSEIGPLSSRVIVRRGRKGFGNNFFSSIDSVIQLLLRGKRNKLFPSVRQGSYLNGYFENKICTILRKKQTKRGKTNSVTDG